MTAERQASTDHTLAETNQRTWWSLKIIRLRISYKDGILPLVTHDSFALSYCKCWYKDIVSAFWFNEHPFLPCVAEMKVVTAPLTIYVTNRITSNRQSLKIFKSKWQLHDMVYFTAWLFHPEISPRDSPIVTLLLFHCRHFRKACRGNFFSVILASGPS